MATGKADHFHLRPFNSHGSRGHYALLVPFTTGGSFYVSCVGYPLKHWVPGAPCLHVSLHHSPGGSLQTHSCQPSCPPLTLTFASAAKTAVLPADSESHLPTECPLGCLRATPLNYSQTAPLSNPLHSQAPPFEQCQPQSSSGPAIKVKSYLTLSFPIPHPIHQQRLSASIA